MRPILALLSLGALVALSQPAAAQTPQTGEQVFQSSCKMCHEPPIERAPSRGDLAKRPRADILTALTTGIMAPMAKTLSPAEVQAVAAYLTPDQGAAAPSSSAQAAAAPRRGAPRPMAGTDKPCDVHPPIVPTATDWASFGRDANSTRYQPNPGFTVADLPKLKVKWSFALAGGGAPTVVGKYLFITNRAGKFYGLDADSGCVHWAASDAVSRTTPVIVRSAASPSGWLAVIGLANTSTRAFDAQTGKVVWTSERLETHQAAGITGAPAVAGDTVYVPLTSGEEGYAIQKTYVCCSFRGSVAALDLKTGKKRWQTYVITEPLRPTRKNEAGIQMQGPAGAAIWSAPTTDDRRGLVYVATGDSYTDADTRGSDAIFALDMKSGKVRWSHQLTQHDNYTMGCEEQFKSPNCPAPHGPDYDFGVTPVLGKTHAGKDILMVGQKSGEAYGLDPATGKLIWKNRLGSGSALGGIEWGIAADRTRLYLPVADTVLLLRQSGNFPATGGEGAPPAEPKPGLHAVDPATGKVIWSAPAPKAPCHYAGDRSGDYTKGECVRAQSSPPSVMPGVVFQGGLDGWLRAYDSATGQVIWADSTTDRTYDTANAVKNQPGGGLDGVGGGPTLANGMLYVMSGFNGASRTGGNGVNVLIAYGVN